MIQIKTKGSRFAAQFSDQKDGTVLIKFVSAYYQGFEAVMYKEELGDVLDIVLGRSKPIEALKSEDV